MENSGYSGNIEYSTHVQNIGWQSFVSNGAMAGTEGRSLRLEAIKIRLTGELADHYDIYYRVHVQNFGWLGWAKNGECSGSAGYSYRLEGIEIKLLEKNSNAPGTINNRFIEKKISYQAHNANIGWASTIYDGSVAGKTGNNLEALKIKLTGTEYSGSVSYSSYVYNVGWQDYVSNNSVSGTTGKSQKIEAIKIKLDGDIANHYDIYYSVYVSNKGWLDWAKNNETTGNIGYGNSIQAIKVKLFDKDTGPASSSNIFSENELKINYSSYINNSGWQDSKIDGAISGTTGQNKNIGAIKLVLNKPTTNGYIKYSVYSHNKGWQNEVSNGTISGIQNRKIEAIKINLSDSLLERYDIYYRVHVSYVGWMDWAKNGEAAGYVDYGQSIEAYEVVLVVKGAAAPGETTNHYREREVSISYQTHISYVGWQDIRSNGETSGTTGQSNRLEAIKINAKSLNYSGSVEYSAHVQNIGWMNFVSDGALGGTEGKSLRLEAIKIRLTGELAEHYDIYYRVHAQNYGWLDWASNGNPAGTRGAGLRLEAIEIVLVTKGGPAPGRTTTPYREGRWENKNGYTYYYDINGKMADDFITIDGAKYFFNSLGHLIARNAKKIIDVSSYNGVIDWNTVKNSGVDGAIIRSSGTYWGTNRSGADIYDDGNFNTYVDGARSVGFSISLYHFSAATTVAEGEKEADHIISKARSIGGVEYIIYDVEYASDSSGNIGRHNNISRDLRTSIIRAFINKVRAAGYTPMLYVNKQICENTATGVDLSKLMDVPLWYARYNHFPGDPGHTITGWQYTSKEHVPGVSSYNVDSSVFGSFV